MTTKFKVTIHKTGEELTNITTMIAHHNSGKASIDLEDITGYMKARKALYPTSNEKQVVKPDLSEPNTIHLSDDNGETFYLSIQECVYEELIENPVLDQYTKENLSQLGEQC